MAKMVMAKPAFLFASEAVIVMRVLLSALAVMWPSANATLHARNARVLKATCHRGNNAAPASLQP